MNSNTELNKKATGKKPVYRREDLDRALGKNIRKAETEAKPRETFGGIGMDIFRELGQTLDRSYAAIDAALPKYGMTALRFIQQMKSAINGNPQLATCTMRSLKTAMMKCASLGLEPNSVLEQAWLIPRRGKNGVMECTFQIGYRGIIELAHRSGKIRNVYADVIKENDEYDYQKGIGAYLRHKQSLQARGKSIAYYAIYESMDGAYGFEIMSREEVEEHRNMHCQSDSPAWRRNFDQMAKKTVLMRLAKQMPMSAETLRKIQEDPEAEPADRGEGKLTAEALGVDGFPVYRADEFPEEEIQDFPEEEDQTRAWEQVW